MRVAQASSLAGISPRTGGGYVTAGIVGWKKDRLAAVAGATAHLSRATVIAICITAALSKLGMTLELAGQAARAFTDIGDENRDPGELFKKGLTALVVYPSGEASVMVADKATLFDAFIGMSRREQAAYILYMGDIVKRVDIAFQDIGDGP